MKIRMYDCKFGDCFQIDEGESRLIVDGGWESQDSSEIISELMSEAGEVEQWSFLLTHYHDDHFRGLCEMIGGREPDRIKFSHIYIPNVWHAETDVELVALLLMSELKKGKLCLIDFLIALLKADGLCYFVQAGDIIENRYEVLWPQKDFVAQKAKNDFYQLWDRRGDSEEATQIKRLATNLIQIIERWNERTFAAFSMQQTILSLQELKDTQMSYLNNRAMLGCKVKPIGLSDYGNNVSIVFQSNATGLSRPNVLFTGDFPKKFWRKINGKLLDSYDVIKIPHHGTKDYYWDKLSNHIDKATKLLIPNGNAGGHDWYVYYKYPEELKLRNNNGNNLEIYCFDMSACPVALGNGHNCVCSPNGRCISQQVPKKKYLEFII